MRVMTMGIVALALWVISDRPIQRQSRSDSGRQASNARGVSPDDLSLLSLVHLHRGHVRRRGKNSTFRDSISVPQLVFLPRAEIAGSAAILWPRWTIKAS